MSFNVKNYGAVGDGTTNDTTAIQAAIDAANNAGGVVANTYSVGTLTLYGGIHLRGSGPGGDVFSGTDAQLPYRGTVLRLRSGTNGDLIRTANFAALTGQTTPSAYATPNRFGIYDMVLDGNKAGNSSGNCLTIYGRSYWLQNLVVQNAAGKGIYSEYGTSAGYDNEAQWVNLRVQDCGGHGIEFFGPHDSLITYVFSARNGGSGFIAGPNSGSLQVSNMHNWGNAEYNFDLQAQDMSFFNCVSDGAGGAGKAGVRLLAGNIRWIGGSLYGSNAPGQVLLRIGDDSPRIIQGCEFLTRW